MSNNARQRKSARELERKRKQQMYLLIGIFVAAALIFVVVILASQPVAAPVQVSEAYDGIEAGVSEEGLPQLGSPDAKAVLHEYSSFGCPHCEDFHNIQFKELLTDVRSGDLRIVFVPISNQFSNSASQAGICALAQGKFWEMHDVLFSWLGQFVNNAFLTSRIMGGAKELGLDEAAFSACLTSADTQAKIDAANQLFFDLAQQYTGVTGTPTITINGVPPDFGSGGPDVSWIRERIAAVSG